LMDSYWIPTIGIQADANLSVRKRYFGSGPALLDGTPCWRDGHDGFWQDEVCVFISPEASSGSAA